MALKKLPCEYPELQEKRWKECFGMFTDEEQLKLMNQISKICDICAVREFKRP